MRDKHPDRRDYDVDKSFRQFIVPAMVLYFLGSAILWVVLPSMESMLSAFYAWILCTFLIGLVTIMGGAKLQSRQMEDAHHGYNVQANSTKPLFPFGTTEYKRYRVDTGGFQGMRMGFDPYAEKLDTREQDQREMPCEVCGTKPKESLDGGYFIETRRLTRVLWLPVRETIVETQAYCVDHKPREFT